MAGKQSAGIVLYRFSNSELKIFLVHPGGPFWAKKDAGAWSIPKGEFNETEDPLEAAKRELKEETGYIVGGDFLELTPVKQSGGKLVYAWAVQGDCNPYTIKSNSFTIEWPPRSGKRQEFPEVDRAGWFDLKIAMEKILKGQAPLLEELRHKVNIS
jgi:predicted NUDIX family NTP pyrophosphohydrolase